MAKRLEGTDRSRSRGASRSAAGEDFHPDYSYVRSDLRRIAYLAGAFLTLLVILSFLID